MIAAHIAPGLPVGRLCLCQSASDRGIGQRERIGIRGPKMTFPRCGIRRTKKSAENSAHRQKGAIRRPPDWSRVKDPIVLETHPRAGLRPRAALRSFVADHTWETE